MQSRGIDENFVTGKSKKGNTMLSEVKKASE
jgi:hypothetical protein